VIVEQESNEALKERGISLADAQLHLDYPTGQIDEGHMESCVDNHWAKGCRLGITYIGKDSDKLVCKDFHNGFVKVQTAALMLLTPREEAAVRCLRKDGRVDGEQVSKVASPVPPKTVKIAYKEQMEKKRKEREEDKYGEYRKCDFILGSAAEIERVWSAAEKGPKSSPFQHPSIFALEYTLPPVEQKYWSRFTVSESIKLVKEEDSSKR
jgi:hypothetical protein